MVPLEAPYPDLYTDTFIFFLRSLCKIILINVHYFPNAPRMFNLHVLTVCKSAHVNGSIDISIIKEISLLKWRYLYLKMENISILDRDTPFKTYIHTKEMSRFK